jgi:hypothetical protein
MKLTTNIVLTGDRGRTQSYMVQLTPGLSYLGQFTFDRYNDGYHHAVLYPESDHSQLIKDGNNWHNEELTGVTYELPKANIRLYFPQYSVDTFDRGTTYILSLTTYIHGVEIRLGDFEVRHSDALACAPVRFNGMDEYYEYVDFAIADPYTLCFGSEAAEFRRTIGEPIHSNDNGSILYVCLYTVEEDADGYVLRNDWGSGQNSLLLTEQPLDMDLNIKYDASLDSAIMTLKYMGDAGTTLEEYIRKTYNGQNTTILWECVIMDEDNIYFRGEGMGYVVMASFDDSFDESFAIESMAHNSMAVSLKDAFKSWQDWRDKLFIVGSVSFIENLTQQEYDDKTYIPYMTVISNKIPITQELFAMLIKGDDFPSQIDLHGIEMINLKAVNKIEKVIMAPPAPVDSTKNHLIQPIFYQTRELNNIVIHPSVTENLAINLDSYKPQVKRFKLQVEGIVFNEIGRTSKGIIFKVYGNMLPKNNDNGIMYILNEENDLVTTGKYSYVY